MLRYPFIIPMPLHTDTSDTNIIIPGWLEFGIKLSLAVTALSFAAFIVSFVMEECFDKESKTLDKVLMYSIGMALIAMAILVTLTVIALIIGVEVDP